MSHTTTTATYTANPYACAWCETRIETLVSSQTEHGGASAKFVVFASLVVVHVLQLVTAFHPNRGPGIIYQFPLNIRNQRDTD